MISARTVPPSRRPLVSPVTSISTGKDTLPDSLPDSEPPAGIPPGIPAGAALDSSAAGAMRLTRPLNFLSPVAVDVNSTRSPCLMLGTSASRTSDLISRLESSARLSSLPCGISPSSTSTEVTTPASGE